MEQQIDYRGYTLECHLNSTWIIKRNGIALGIAGSEQEARERVDGIIRLKERT